MAQAPKLDLSKFDLLTAKDKLFEYVCMTAKSWGMDPSIECSLLSPKKSAKLGYGPYWYVMWEAGPYQWGTNLALDGVTFKQMDGPFDRKTPELVMGNPSDWYLESYYSFDVGFIPTSVFADFSTDEDSSIITACTGYVSQQLTAQIAKHPTLLSTLDRRAFEKLIAELFDGFGFSVELTQQTRDGGKDIIAIGKIHSIDIRYLIECKRPEPGRKISIATVRDLLGVKTDDPASKALLVTTTDFTPDARSFIERHKWNLEGKAYEDIVYWVNEYNRIKGIQP